jgi:hypothetical protein
MDCSTRFLSLSVAVFLMRDDFSDDRTDVSFSVSVGPRQRSHSRVGVPRDSSPYVTGGSGPVFKYPKDRVAQLYLQPLGRHFVLN